MQPVRAHSQPKGAAVRFQRYASAAVLLLVVAIPAEAAPIARRVARQVAQNFIAHHVSVHGTWNGTTSPEISSITLVRLRGTPLAYNVLVKPSGHLLVAYDDFFSPVLLYSDTSAFDAARVEKAGTVESWILPEIRSTYERLLRRSAALEAGAMQRAYARSRVAAAWARFTGGVRGLADEGALFGHADTQSVEAAPAAVGPLTTTAWNQGYPYNLYTPLTCNGGHAVTGCTATAIAQVMKYWNSPDWGTGSHTYYLDGYGYVSADFNHAYYWWLMPNAFYGGETDAERDAVARLMSDVGVAVEMAYGCSSGAWPSYGVHVALPNYFGYRPFGQDLYRNHFSSDVFFGLIREELDAPRARPMLLTVYTANYAAGHAIVIDGYQTVTTNQVHLNLGWGGSYTGYYDITNNWSAGGYAWDTNTQIIQRGIEPGNLPPVVPGRPVLISPAGLVSVTTPTFRWISVPEATGYTLTITRDGIGDTHYSYGPSVCDLAGTCSATPATLTNNASYHWSVTAGNAAGQGSASAALEFWTLIAAPGSFQKVAPTNGATDQAVSLTLSWGTSAAAVSYEYCLDRIDNNVCDGIWTSVGGANSAQISSLVTGTTYYWQVRAVNAAGTTEANTGSWWRFTTVSVGTYFFDDMENGGAGWAIGQPWSVTTESAYSGSHSWSDSPFGNYAADRNTSIVSSPIDLRAARSPRLRFWTRYDFAPDGYDSGNVWITTDGGHTYAYLAGCAGTSVNWTERTVDLTVYAGIPNVRIVFQIISNGALSSDGWYIDDVTVAEGPTSRAVLPGGDYDGDGRTDVAVYRPVTGTWYVIRSNSGFGWSKRWGLPGDTPVPADYDGDGRTDIAVFRSSNNTWYIVRSSTGSAIGIRWGALGDLPVPADFDGDGRADPTVFRPATGMWYQLRSTTGLGYGVRWGTVGDIPLAADFDGDRRADPTVFRPAIGRWFQLRSTTGTGFGLVWGQNGDRPIVGDFDGDGRADPTVFRATTSTWYELRSSTGAGAGVVWGVPTDLPVIGDYDGDRRADPTVFRPSNGTWYQRRSTGGAVGVVWGILGDLPR
jgi:hypothetical protein